MRSRPNIYTMAAAGVAVVALGLGAQAFSVLAQPMKTMRGFQGDFATLDADKDGKVTREEFNRPPPDPFDAMDANKDGAISEDEFKAFKPRKDLARPGGMPGGPDGPPPPGGGRQKLHHDRPGQDGLDENKDGKVSFEEFSAPVKAHFAQLDSNKDGTLSDAELASGDVPPFGPPPAAGR